MSVFMLATDKSDNATQILRECDEKTAHAALSDPQYADCRIVERKALGSLTGSELVSIYNNLVSKADQVSKFSDKETAVRRVLEAWSADSQPMPAVEPNAEPVVLPKSKVNKKKPKAASPGRPRKTIVGTLQLIEANCANKRWNKGSLRSAVFQELEAQAPVDADTFIPSCAKKLKVTEDKVRGCIVKIIGVNCAQVK